MSFKIDTFRYFNEDEVGELLNVIARHVKNCFKEGYKLACLEVVKNPRLDHSYIFVKMKKEDN